MTIEDNGMGMNKQKIDNLFKGSMVSSLGTNNEKGTGLGLALVRQSILALEGDMEIESFPETGTKVILVLPVNQKTKTTIVPVMEQN